MKAESVHLKHQRITAKLEFNFSFFPNMTWCNKLIAYI